MYVLYYALGVLACYGRAAFSNPTTYDQRQTGDLNVQIHLKDVQVVALLDSELFDGYTDYDYSYDYADFTIKPIVKPTSSPVSTSSVKPWNTWPTNPPTSSTTASSASSVGTVSSPSTTASPSSSVETAPSSSSITEQPAATSPSNLDNQTESNITADPSEIQSAKNETTIKLRINDKIVDELFTDSAAEKQEEDDASVEPTSETSSKKQCPSGYVLNKKGRCRAIQSRRRVSLVPLTMKLGSKLSQKGRFTVRKDLPIRVYKSEAQR